MSKQLFGWTHPKTPERGYVGYVMAHQNDDGSFKIVVRQHQGGAGGEANDIPAAEAYAMAEAILATRPSVEQDKPDATDKGEESE